MAKNNERDLLASALLFLGFEQFSDSAVVGSWGFSASIDEQQLANKIAKRWMELRLAKSFDAADLLRDQAAEIGLTLQVENIESVRSATAIINSKIAIEDLQRILK